MILFRWLLRAYPREFRRLYGAELEADFADLLAATRPRGRRAVARLWLRTVVDTLKTGLAERLSGRGYRRGRSRLRIPGGGLWERVADGARDLRIGFRSLARAPGFVAAVVTTLALGIGATTALFSVTYGILLRPLPFTEGDRLVRLVQEVPPATDPDGPATREGFSVADLASYARRVRGLEEMAEVHAMTFTLIDARGPHRVQAGVVSANYFDFLGWEAVHGRVLHPAEDHLGADPVIVLAHGYWVERFGADPTVVGRRMQMNDRVHRVVGVLPPRPRFPVEADIFLPISACPTRSDPDFIADRGARMMFAYARTDPGLAMDSLAARSAAALAELAREHPAAYPVDAGFRVRVRSLRDDMVAEARPLLLALTALAGCLLLIACANAAGLALARAGRRLWELEVRGALGAGRGRLVRTLLVESVTLALAGGLLGLGIAFGGHDLLVGFAERFTPRAEEIRLDGAVLAFAGVTAVVAGLLFGAVPGVWVGGRVRRSALESGGVTVGSRGRRLQRGLVIGQVAVAFAVVTAAGLALRTVWRLGSTELGFETASVVSLEVSVHRERWQNPDSARVLFDRIAERLRADPRVGKVARSMGTPLTGHLHRDAYFVVDDGDDGDGGDGGHGGHDGDGGRDGRNAPIGAGVGDGIGAGADEAGPAVALARIVDPGFFEILGMRLLRGRTFRPGDGPDAPRVAVVNRAFEQRVLEGRGGIGSTLVRCHSPADCQTTMRIVGVVEDVRFDGPDHPVEPEVYQVARQDPVYGGEHLLLEVRGDPDGLEAALTAGIHEVAPELAVSDYATLDGLRQDSSRPRRFLAALLASFGAVAAGLAVTGIFGVASLSAASRMRELGIRRALGASPAGLVRQVVAGAGVVAAIGIAGGLVLAGLAAATFGGVVRSWLWGVTPHDPATLAATALLFAAVAALAAWIPARRVARLDPVQVLKRP